jgi:hypothetical protein
MPAATRATTSRGKQKASVTDEEEILLNCLVRGDDRTIVVCYQPTTRVYKLKELIYERRAKTVYHDIQRDDLTLYNVCHVIQHSEFPNNASQVDLPFENLAGSLSELTTDNIPQKHVLRDGTQLVSDLWPEQPAAGLIHVFVDPLGTNELGTLPQLSLSNLTCLHSAPP